MLKTFEKGIVKPQITKKTFMYKPKVCENIVVFVSIFCSVLCQKLVPDGPTTPMQF